MNRTLTESEIAIIRENRERENAFAKEAKEDMKRNRSIEAFNRTPPQDLKGLYKRVSVERANICLLCAFRKVGSAKCEKDICEKGLEKEVSSLITCGKSSCTSFFPSDSSPTCFIRGTWVPIPAALLIETYLSRVDNSHHAFLVKNWKRIGSDFINRHEGR